MNLWQRIFGAPKLPEFIEPDPFGTYHNQRLNSLWGGLMQNMTPEDQLKLQAGAATAGDWLRAILKGESPMHGKTVLEQIQVHIDNLNRVKTGWRLKAREADAYLSEIEATLCTFDSIRKALEEEAHAAEKEPVAETPASTEETLVSLVRQFDTYTDFMHWIGETLKAYNVDNGNCKAEK